MKPKIQATFDSPDALMVQALKSIITGASIGTRWKRDTNNPQIIVSFAGGTKRGNGQALAASYNLRVSAADYATVEELAMRITNLLCNYRQPPFHWIEIESFPISFEEDGFSGEQRLIAISALIAGN